MLRLLFIIHLSITLGACGSFSDPSSSENTGNKEDAIRGNPKDIDSAKAGSIRLANDQKKGRATLYEVQSNKPLELPPELITSANETVLTGIQKSEDEALNILPDPVNARIVKQGNERWLEIDASVEKAWKSVLEYWALGSVDLVDYDPEAGLMETQWIEQAAEPKKNGSAFLNVARNIVTSFTKTNTSLDKFRLRFERVSENKSLMYVSHRSIARQELQFTKKLNEFEWVELPSDPEREAVLLQNLVLIFDESAAS